MNFLDLKDISERHHTLVNPISSEKVVRVGQALGLRPGDRVVDFGCGYGEVLALWGEHFGVAGIGIDIRPNAVRRARDRLSEKGMTERFEIVCADAAVHTIETGAYDAAACIGASFIWPSFGDALRAMRQAVRPDGRMAIGEVSWRTSAVAPEFARSERFHTEPELLSLARQHGLDVTYLVRASQDDWDEYEAKNWLALYQWLAEHPDDPRRDDVAAHLRLSQDEYFRFGREYLGWAIYALAIAAA